ncbi:unnamed protein product [Ceratitis capitata]|uniref:(Mediterranean fruit fly) hypothetical protein n=1 Tax=Ceratitis capitata TaxID=7213 RepID=A0A811V2I2_CERCA|nr:unnamed protein product [Ceratitis capitata]
MLVNQGNNTNAIEAGHVQIGRLPKLATYVWVYRPRRVDIRKGSDKLRHTNGITTTMGKKENFPLQELQKTNTAWGLCRHFSVFSCSFLLALRPMQTLVPSLIKPERLKPSSTNN